MVRHSAPANDPTSATGGIYSCRAVLATASVVLMLMMPAASASDADSPFVVAKYPVQAHAQNAVAAKERAIADGQQAAFRSLVKRLIPVTDYKALGKLKSTQVAGLIEGLSVRAERNSSTSYTATLDFSFNPNKVRDVMFRAGIRFVDEQAAATAIVPVFLPPSAGGGASLSQASGEQMWRDAWAGLDLEHALTPVKLHAAPPSLTPQVIAASLKDANAPLRAIAALSKTGQALLAIAEPDPAGKRLHVTLTGTDAVGSFVLRRSWRLDLADPAYSAEFAAVVALATIEGRWKATRDVAAIPLPPSGAALMPVQLVIEYRSLNEWQALQKRIATVPGVSDFVIAGLTAQGADAALRYPGGGEQLAAALAAQGIELTNARGTWYAKSRR